MSSFTNLLIIVFMVQFCLITTGYTTIPGSAIYDFASNPTDWNSSVLIKLILDLTTAVGLVSVVIGLYFIKNDFIVFAGTVATFLSFGAPLIQLFTLLKDQFNYIWAATIVGPIILLYVMTLLAWWRGRAS